jgi:L-threonylcarbamoyladenylate synthase
MIEKVEEAIRAFQEGKVVALNTDTLFALSCDATNENAVTKVFSLKKRSAEKSLPVFISSIEQATKYAELSEQHIKLATEFWPGALTIIAPIKKHSKLAYNISNTNTVALRIPADDTILAIINKLNCPLVGTSANISGQPNIYSVDELHKNFGSKVYLGLCHDIPKPSTNLPQHSTIVYINAIGECKIIRQGAISQEKIAQTLK